MPRGIIPTSYVSFEKGKGVLKWFGHGTPPKSVGAKVGPIDVFNAAAQILSRWHARFEGATRSRFALSVAI
jgi:hypothetical protein